MHVDRLVTFYKAARSVGRIFLVDAYAAYVLYLVSPQCRIPGPDAQAGSRVYENVAFRNRNRGGCLNKVREVFASNLISLDDVLASPDRYVMVFRPSMLDSDFGGRLPSGVCCIYSYWTGYLRQREWSEVRRHLEGSGGTLVECHTSGHIYAGDLDRLIREIQPASVIPIHTFEPQLFRGLHANVVPITDGVPRLIE